jgi:hypothetical protein
MKSNAYHNYYLQPIYIEIHIKVRIRWLYLQVMQKVIQYYRSTMYSSQTRKSIKRGEQKPQDLPLKKNSTVSFIYIYIFFIIICGSIKTKVI